jgi:hypothetical protein
LTLEDVARMCEKKKRGRSKGLPLTLYFYFLRKNTAATITSTTTPATPMTPTVKRSKSGASPAVPVGVVVSVVVGSAANPPGTSG